MSFKDLLQPQVSCRNILCGVLHLTSSTPPEHRRLIHGLIQFVKSRSEPTPLVATASIANGTDRFKPRAADG